jgi:hypothetical protein
MVAMPSWSAGRTRRIRCAIGVFTAALAVVIPSSASATDSLFVADYASSSPVTVTFTTPHRQILARTIRATFTVCGV